MKKMLFCLLLVSSSVLAQVKKPLNYTDYKALAKYNLPFLDKKGSVAHRVLLKEHIFELKAHDGLQEVWIPWSGMKNIIARLELEDHHTLYNGYLKTIKDLSGGTVANGLASDDYHPVPVDFGDLVIAVDPGHFAGNFQEAIKEQKYVKLRGQDLGQSKDVAFYEAFLTDVTSYLVKVEAEKLGAHVVLTKQMGQNALGKSFKEWFKKDFRSDLQIARNAGDIDQKYFEEELKLDSSAVFNRFFRFVEFRKRIDMINDLKPSVTIAIHYNAKEGGKRDAEGYLKPVEDNYSMAFVPGAFMSHELKRPSEKLDFIRLLLSSDLDKSMRLAHLILTEEQSILGIAPVSDKDHVLDDRSCNPTQYAGVYCRNLALTRTIRGPIVYLEALLQDNKDMALKLASKDYEIDHPAYGKMLVPKICYDEAMAIVKGIQDWLEENKSYASALTAEKTSKQ